MKKILLDGCFRAVMLWMTFKYYFSEKISSSFICIFLILVGSIVVSCFGIFYTYYINPLAFIKTSLISIGTFIITLFVLVRINIPLQEVRELAPGDGIIVPLYLFTFCSVMIILRFTLMICSIIKKRKKDKIIFSK